MRLTSLSRLALTLLLAPACHLALGADNAPSVESFFKDPVTRSATLSPQGHYVALVTRMADGKQVLAVRDTSDLKSVTVPLTAPDDNKIVALHWINEQRIGFTLKNYRIEFESNQDEFAVDRDGSNLVHLISGNFKHHQDKLGTNIKDKVLTSDYAFVSTTHDGSDDIIVSRYMWNNIDPYPDSSRLYRLNTRRQTLTDLLPAGQPAHALRWITDADASPRIAIAHAEGHCIDYYRAPGSADWKEIANADCNKRLYTPLFFDGAGTLYVTAAYKGYSALFRYNVETQTRDKEPMLTVPGFDYHGAPLFDTSSRKLLGIRLDSDAVATVWFDARFKALQKKIDALLPQTNNAISCAADCLNAPAVLVTSASDRQPTEYFIYTLANGAIVGLGGSNPDIKPAQMGLRDFYHYTARDGLSIPVYVTTPPGKAGTAWPTVVLVHGGPSVRGGSWEWSAEAQFLASRGYLVVEPEFRGSAGFGFRHFQAGWRQWGQGMQTDLADAAQWAVQKGWADPKRIGIMGGSYGGYATLMGLIENPEIFRCGVEWAGVTDLNLMFNTSWDDASEELLQYGMRTIIGDPDKDADMFQRYSPLPNAARLTQPLLMAHGAQDRRVPTVHASKFLSAVRNTNAHVESLIYADEAHSWRHEEDSIDFWKHVDAFLDQNLKRAQ